MNDNFTDLHELHNVGNMSEHTINGEDISTGVRNSFSEQYSTANGGHEWTEKNAEGGEDVYHGTVLFERTIPTGHGKHDIYGPEMQLKGSVVPNVHGGHDVLQGANLVASGMSLGPGVTTMMNHLDPIAHYSEHVWTKLIL